MLDVLVRERLASGGPGVEDAEVVHVDDDDEFVEDRRPRSRLVDGHTHTHSVLTTQGLHLRSFVPLRRGFAKTVLQRRGFALHLQP